MSPTPWRAQSGESVVSVLQSDPERGLQSDEADQRRRRYGSNEITSTPPPSTWSIALLQLKDPMNLMLVAVAAVSIAIGEVPTAIVVAVLVVLNIVLGTRQELKARASVDALAKMQTPQARVIRDGNLIQLDATELVPGDIVQVEAGDIIAADGRLLATSSLSVGELVSDAMVDAKLAYRLATVTIHVPPLRERNDDLLRIADAMLAEIAMDAGRPQLVVTEEARQLLKDHPWLGNLREMRNVLTRLVLLSPSDEVDADTLARALGFPSAEARRLHKSGLRNRVRTTTRRPRNSSVPVPRLSGLLATALDEPARAERERIENALEATEGHRERAAAVLGMSRTTLWTRMRMLGIDYERFRRSKAV